MDEIAKVVKRSVSIETIAEVQKWLGKSGIIFFQDLQKKYGRVDAIWVEDSIPHCVHFREGMQVRNFLRTTKECQSWNPHDLDNNWVEIIEEVIKDKS